MMPLFCKHVLSALSLRLALAERVGFELLEEVAVEEHGFMAASCPVEKCNVFGEASRPGECSCDPFLDNPESKEEDKDVIAAKAMSIMFTVSQQMRFLVDWESSKSFWQSMWLPNKYAQAKIFGASIQDFSFVQAAIDRVEKVQEFAQMPVSDLPKDKVPAGVFPIVVEIWDKGIVSGDFLGEAGIPLVKGTQAYTEKLRPNPSRNAKYAEKFKNNLGSVTVTTEVDFDMATNSSCYPGSVKTCVNISLTVTCNKAQGLPKTGYWMTDPYCKVRVKKDAGASTKHKTPVINNQLNPKWTKENSFKYNFRVPVATETNGKSETEGQGETEGETVDEGKTVTKVLYTWDQMSLEEQFVMNTIFTVEQKGLGGKSCSEVSTKTETQKSMCALITNLQTTRALDGATDLETPGALDQKEEDRKIAEVFKQAKSQLSDEDQASVKRMVEEDAKENGLAGSPMLLELDTDRLCISALNYHRRRSRSRRGGSGGYSGGKEGGGVAIFVIIIIIILCCVLR